MGAGISRQGAGDAGDSFEPDAGGPPADRARRAGRAPLLRPPRQGKSTGVSPTDEGGPAELAGGADVPWAVPDPQRVALAPVAKHVINHGARGLDDCRLGGDVATNGNLPIFMVAPATKGANLREDEPYESRRAAPAVTLRKAARRCASHSWLG